jgi:hypothetical protein
MHCECKGRLAYRAVQSWHTLRFADVAPPVLPVWRPS